MWNYAMLQLLTVGSNFYLQRLNRLFGHILECKIVILGKILQLFVEEL